MAKEHISITLSKEVYKKIMDETKRTGLSKSAVIDQICRRYFKIGYVPLE